MGFKRQVNRVSRLFLRSDLFLLLSIALLLRVLLWERIPRTGLISDEGEYLSAAYWLAHGRGWAWYLNYLWTRAPLYPLFLAASVHLFGDTLLVYLAQVVLSLVNVVLVYRLAVVYCQSFVIDEQQRTDNGRRTAFLAALLMGLYLPFALYTQVLLSETLYLTLLLSAFLVLAGDEQRITGLCSLAHPLTRSVMAGALFGLATLTRSLTLGFVPIVALWMLLRPPVRRRVLPCCLFTFIFCLFLLPWTIYNTRLYGGLVLLDTSGAYNLMLGARTAADGKRLDAPTRDFVRMLVDPGVKTNDPKVSIERVREQLLIGFFDGERVIGRSCLLEHRDPRLLAALARPYDPEPNKQIPQAQVQQLLIAEGLCLIREHPGAFIQKALVTLVDFFQINYSGDERFTDGFTTGRLSSWYSIALFLLDDTLYMLALPLGVLGFGIRRLEIRNWKLRSHGLLIPNSQSSISLIGLWFLYTVIIASLLFAINRFRLPLLPFMFIFTAYALVGRKSAAPPRSNIPTDVGKEDVGEPPSENPARFPNGLGMLRVDKVCRFKMGYLRGLSVGWVALVITLTLIMLPSYFGTSWSSASYTYMAVTNRPKYLATERARQALHNGDVSTARMLINADLTKEGELFAPVLLHILEGRYDDAQKRLDQAETNLKETAARDTRDISDNDKVKIATLQGELLRRQGDQRGALQVLGSTLVDRYNPVQWAWDWLYPVPTREINVGGTLDLGYVEGCYLGEGDTDEHGRPFNVRWCSNGARLRFSHGGTGAPQTLTLRVDGRGWPKDQLPVSPVHVLVNSVKVATFTPSHTEVKEFDVTLPAIAHGADIIVTLQTSTFIPNAADYLRQQGPFAGQVRQLGVRLDMVRLR